jgi:hypothetical protein
MGRPVAPRGEVLEVNQGEHLAVLDERDLPCVRLFLPDEVYSYFAQFSLGLQTLSV